MTKYPKTRFEVSFFDHNSEATMHVSFTTDNLTFDQIKKEIGDDFDPDYNTIEISTPVVVNDPNFRS